MLRKINLQQILKSLFLITWLSYYLDKISMYLKKINDFSFFILLLCLLKLFSKKDVTNSIKTS